MRVFERERERERGGGREQVGERGSERMKCVTQHAAIGNPNSNPCS